MADPVPMTSADLATHVRSRVDATSTGWNSHIAHERARLTREFNAERYGNEVDGRSAFVSSDIADTVQWIMPTLIETFVGGDKAVEFEPMGEEDEEAADQEGDVLNHEFINKCEGYSVLWSWFSDALTQYNGVCEVSWDRKRDVKIEEYADLTMEQITMMLQDLQARGIEVTPLSQSSRPAGPGQFELDPQTGQPMLDEMGQPVPLMLYSVKFRAVTYRGCLMVEPVPPEEFFVSSDWTKVSVDDARLCGRRKMVTRSELIEMGVDRDQAETAGTTGSMDWAPERTARHNGDWLTDTDFDNDRVEWTIAYIKVDFDGDGIEELRRVGMIGNEIIRWQDGTEDNEEVDYNPFCVITPYIVAHRHYGDCPARAVSDLQRMKSDLVRAMMDQIAMASFPPVEAGEGALNEYTIEDLLNRGPDSIIRTRQVGQLREIPIQPATVFNIQAIEFVDSLREKRTGTSAYNQGMDADSLNKTASGISQILTESQKKVMTIARTFAETGVKDLFRKMHRLLKRYGDREIAVKLRNAWVATNPREWADRTNLQVAVGLGSGSKPEKFAMTQQLLALQMQLQPLGLASTTQIKHTADKLVALSGYKNPDLFFQDPAQMPQPEQGPSPEQLLAEAEQDKANVAREKILLEDDRERDKMEFDFALEAAKLYAEHGVVVDRQSLAPLVDQQRVNALRAEQDAQVNSTIKIEEAKKRFAAQQQDPANAA